MSIYDLLLFIFNNIFSSLKIHAELNSWLLIYWNTCYHDISNNIPKQEYIELLLKISTVLIENFDIKYSYNVCFKLNYFIIFYRLLIYNF